MLEKTIILIINNSYIKVGNFCLDFVVNAEVFEITNTIFEAEN